MDRYNNIPIIYEDNHLLVVCKPKRIPSQSDKTGDIDILTILKNYLKEKYNKPGNVYLGLVHRLDRMTEGLMVFAKTSKAASRLSENIRQGDFKKKYIAVLNGKFHNSDCFKWHILENYMCKNEKLNMSRICDENIRGAKRARLEYMPVKSFKDKDKDYTYVDVKLYTGRHHQIRVQLSNIGHPLYGDIKYGSKVNKIGQDLGLFAYSLEFFHPTKDEVVKIEFLPEKNGIWSELDKWN